MTIQVPPDRPIELWGGVECTVNRVGDRYFDQLARSRHLARPSDIDKFAELGLTALRVPILWERCAPLRGQVPCFEAFDPMLARTRERGLRAIAGLVHHGSGPPHTSLLDPAFERELAEYARVVAETYPWIEDYTPVNEPLTTARFSGLYGHWYPHGRDTPTFLRALVHECRAIVRAMRAIREVNPRARLVQTEDVASVRSTPLLAYQAEYENTRRFLGFDLLCGRVDATHPLYEHLVQSGVTEAELAWFLEHACPPDLIGINYYFTSDRFLDERLEAYPPWSHGGNGRHAYADVDSGLAGIGLVGHQHLLSTIWERYRIPVALTEVHAGCTREEQLRWLLEAYEAARAARAHGADVRALTVWSLLGAFDWNSLVTVERGVYEPGVYDVRGAELRPTALAALVEALAHGRAFEHPLLARDGWWHRPRTVAPTPAQRDVPSTLGRPGPRSGRPQPLVITGAGGSLAQALARSCEVRGIDYVLLSREELDIADRAAVRAALSSLSPWAVINAAGVAHPEVAVLRPDYCRRANLEGPVLLAEACRERGARLLTFSSDQVFDGAYRRPYLESDPVRPLSVHGEAQAEAERQILGMACDALIVRTSALFGPVGERDVVARALLELAGGRPAELPSDAVISPTYIPHLVDACLDLLIDGAEQLWHLANVGAMSWPELVRRIAEASRLPSELLSHARPSPAARPRYSVLGSERALLMPSLEVALECYLRDRMPIAAALGAA